MEWIIQREIPDKLINRKFIDRSVDYINLDAYVLTNRVYVGCVTDNIKKDLLKELVSKVYEVELPLMFSTKRDRPLTH